MKYVIQVKTESEKTTISEAQLIGRGARYFPFVLPDHPDRFRRKFDEELNHELRVLEELHYHSIHDSRYISEIRTALIEQGYDGRAHGDSRTKVEG